VIVIPLLFAIVEYTMGKNLFISPEPSFIYDMPSSFPVLILKLNISEKKSITDYTKPP
jgi:hypothetical protein|tara:strand:+ start:1512 stop:1685 length:174 start_codon:yes stop_codon:yes gene_type:complete